MKLMRLPTKAEWKEFEKAGPGVRMYRGLKTLFYDGGPLADDKEERDSWEQIIILSRVERIPAMAFKNCINVKRVFMSDSVKIICYSAFVRCTSLMFIKLSKNLEVINAFAFQNCKLLYSIFIPPTCRRIGPSAFYGCSGLLLFHVHEGTKIQKGNIEFIGLFLKLSRFRIPTDELKKRGPRWIREHHLGVFNKHFPGNHYPLHKICCSENPTFDKEYQLQEWLEGDDVHLTPLHYLFLNPNTDADTIKTVLTSYHGSNGSEIKKRADKWIRKRWTIKDRDSYEYPLHERCQSENPTFDREYTLKEWLEEDDIDLTPLHYIFVNPNVDSGTIQPILTAFERAYNGCELNIEEKLNLTAYLPSNSSEESPERISNTATNMIPTSGKEEVSAKHTSTTEETLPSDEVHESLSNRIATTAVDFSALRSSKSKEASPLAKIAKDTLTTSAKDSDLQVHKINSVATLQTIAKTNTKNFHFTPHDNLRGMQSIAKIPIQNDEIPKPSTITTPAVTPFKRKYEELLDQHCIDDSLNEMEEEYDATIKKNIQSLHEECEIRRRREDSLRSHDLSKKEINSNLVELTRLDEKRNESDESSRKFAARLSEEESRNSTEKMNTDRLTKENTSLQMKVEILLEEKELLTNSCKSLIEKAQILVKSSTEFKQNAHLAYESYACDKKHLMEENEKLLQKLKTYEHLDKVTNRLTKENTSLQMEVKVLKEDKQALTKTCKHLTEKRRILEQSTTELKQKADLKFESYRKASENEKRLTKRKLESLTEENEQHMQKLKTYDHLDKVISNTKEELECPICLERFTNPHVTKCGHRFCKRCIEEHIRQATKQKKEKTCPSCREPIVSKRDLRRDELITRVVEAVFQDGLETC